MEMSQILQDVVDVNMHSTYGQRHAKRDLRTYAKSVDPDATSGQDLHFLTLVTSRALIFLATCEQFNYVRSFATLF